MLRLNLNKPCGLNHDLMSYKRREGKMNNKMRPFSGLSRACLIILLKAEFALSPNSTMYYKTVQTRYNKLELTGFIFIIHAHGLC